MADAYDREGLIDRATDAINGGDPARALLIAEEIRKGEGPNADEALIRGIALSSLGRTAEASDAFAEAARQAPGSHKARFNAAVHEFNAGNVEGARELADEALKLDPAHGGTRSLVEKIAAHGRPAPAGAVPPLAPPPDVLGAPVGRASVVDDEESLPWIGRLGPNWLVIGIFIVVLNFVAFVAIGAMAVQASGALKSTLSFGESLAAGQQAARSLQSLPLFQLFSFIDLFARVASIGWTVLDLVRRRGNFLWLVPVVPLSCCSVSWIVIPIYMIFGRKS